MVKIVASSEKIIIGNYVILTANYEVDTNINQSANITYKWTNNIKNGSLFFPTETKTYSVAVFQDDSLVDTGSITIQVEKNPIERNGVYYFYNDDIEFNLFDKLKLGTPENGYWTVPDGGKELENGYLGTLKNGDNISGIYTYTVNDISSNVTVHKINHNKPIHGLCGCYFENNFRPSFDNLPKINIKKSN